MVEGEAHMDDVSSSKFIAKMFLVSFHLKYGA